MSVKHSTSHLGLAGPGNVVMKKDTEFPLDRDGERDCGGWGGAYTLFNTLIKCKWNQVNSGPQRSWARLFITNYKMIIQRCHFYLNLPVNSGVCACVRGIRQGRWIPPSTVFSRRFNLDRMSAFVLTLLLFMMCHNFTSTVPSQKQIFKGDIMRPFHNLNVPTCPFQYFLSLPRVKIGRCR